MALSVRVPVWAEDEFSATAGQVTFIMSQSPFTGESVRFLVNGVEYSEGDDWTRSGLTLTWLNNGFSMDTGDRVSIRYEV